MIRYLADPANVITMIGLLFSAFGFYLVLAGQIEFGVASVLWAALMDDLDGIVASRTRNRRSDLAKMGKSLDGFADIVYGAVFPAVVILQISNAEILSLVTAMAMLTAGALRLSYFNNFGLSDDGRFLGVPLFYDVPLLAVFLLLRPVLPVENQVLILNLVFLVLALLHVSSIRVPATTGPMYAVTTLCIVSASALLIAGQVL